MNRRLKRLVLLICILIFPLLVVAQERKSSSGVDTFGGNYSRESAAPNEKLSLWYRRPAAV